MSSSRTPPEQMLADMGITLPEAPKPVASYVPARRSGGMVFISGQIPMVDGKLMASGVVPTQVAPEVAADCARRCAINGLAALRAEIGDLSRVERVVRVGVFVASEPGFHEQPRVANGASDLLVKVFGEAGRHARAAVGAADLPLGAPVEVEFIFEVR